MANWKRQHRWFVFLLMSVFILVGLLAVRYDRAWDLTWGQKNQLHNSSIEIVKQLQSPLEIIAFTRGNPKVKALINRLLSRYQQHGDIHWTFKNPDTELALVKAYQVSRDGELILRYQGRQAHSAGLSETDITRAIEKLLHHREKHILFVTGHGERDLDNANGGLGALYERLSNVGNKVGQIDLNIAQQIPEKTDLLVIADAKIDYQAKEITAIIDYLQRGGRLLWLNEAHSNRLSELADFLDVTIADGVLINRSGKKYDLDNLAYVVVEPRSDFAPLKPINTMLLFPETAVLNTDPAANPRWQHRLILPVAGESFIKDGLTITNPKTPPHLGLFISGRSKEQNTENMESTEKSDDATTDIGGSAVVLGDADFLSNQFIGFGQNAEFADHLFKYLTARQTQFVHITTPMPPVVVIPEQTLFSLAAGLMFGVPLLLLVMGFMVRLWLRKRK